MSNNNTLHVVIERHPNKELTSFHVNRRLSASRNPVRFAYDNDHVVVDSICGNVNVEPLAQQTAEKIYEIDGVQSGLISGGVSVYDYKVTVSHSRAFDENDIEFAVVEALVDVFNVSLDDVTFELDDYARSKESKERERISELAYARMSL